MKKILKWVGIILLVVAITAGALFMIYLRPFMKKMEKTQVEPYDDQLTLIIGGGGNTGILTSDSLVLVVDTKMSKAAEKLYDTVMQMAAGKPILVVNTHYHSDHTTGNKFFKGQKIAAGGTYTREVWKKEAGEETMPNLWIKDSLQLKVGNETVTILNIGKNVHTVSDLVVYLHNRKMLFGGDVILNQQAPAIFAKSHSDPEGYLNAFDMLQKRYDIQKVVPGHGSIGGPEVINNFRQYFKDMYTAAEDDNQKDALEAKYKDWAQIPVLMSPGATVNYIKDHKK